jgi:ribosomal protein S18 acetylase RimI-like enzyme
MPMINAGSVFSLSFERTSFKELKELIKSIFPDCLVSAEKEDIVFKASAADETVGFVHIGTRENGWRIIGIGIKETNRGREYGKRILDFAIETIRQMGGHSVTLLVDGKNSAAIRMYIKAGFKPIGKHRNRAKLMLTLNN